MFWVLLACGEVGIGDAPAVYPHVVFDPGGGAIPMPNDLVRDEADDRLALPLDGDLSAAELAVRRLMNQQDAFSSVTPISFDVSVPVDPDTVRSSTVQVWEMGVEPAPVAGLTWSVANGGSTVEVRPPASGWRHGGQYAVLVRGGDEGLQTSSGRPMGPDAAFTYLLAVESLTDHPRAFPGATQAERQAAAVQLEQARLSLQPTLAHAEAVGLTRGDLAAAFTFGVTRRPELAMDESSQRIPLPFDLLIDPDTGNVDLPPNPDDTPLEADARAVANTLNGFSVTAALTFEASAALDPTTVTADAVQLWDLTRTPVRVPAQVHPWRASGPCEAGDDGCIYVVVDPEPIPLDPGTTYAVVVTRGVTGRAGEALLPMPVGQLLRSAHPLFDGASSTISSLDDDQARRLEGVRGPLESLAGVLDPASVVAAWPFTTLDPVQALRDTVNIASALRLDVAPRVTLRGPANRLFGEDPLSDLFPGALNPADTLYLPRVDGVGEVIEGVLPIPMHLDPVTRRWQEPARPDFTAFMAVVPEGADPEEPLPVVIFGHAITTDRRFLLTVAGALAKRGFVAVSIDLPYHGTRTACIDASLVAIPNFFPEALQDQVGLTEPLLYLPRCASGADATCSPNGRCIGPNGPEDFNHLPIIDILPASGAAFLDVHDLPHIPDHFRQALVDLGALRYSLQTADWEAALGQRITKDRFLFAGQSLGGILGAVYVASDPWVTRAVLNVPGANLVDLFIDSTFFGPQMDAFVDDLGVEPGTWEHRRLLDVARWLIDSVDPLSVAHVYRTGEVDALIQMDRVNEQIGDFVIPNHTTELLAEVSGLPVVTYPSVLHGDLVIPLVGDAMLEDLADFLAAEAP